MVKLETSTKKILSLTHSYDIISVVYSVSRISFVFNDSYVFEIQAEYSRILVMRCHLCEYDVRAASMRIFKAEFIKYSFNQVVSMAKIDTIVRTNTVLEKLFVIPVVLVYTNDRKVQDIAFIIQLVDSTDFHKQRFKTKSYISCCRRVSIDISKSSEPIPANIIYVRDCCKKYEWHIVY